MLSVARTAVFLMQVRLALRFALAPPGRSHCVEVSEGGCVGFAALGAFRTSMRGQRKDTPHAWSVTQRVREELPKGGG